MFTLIKVLHDNGVELFMNLVITAGASASLVLPIVILAQVHIIAVQCVLIFGFTMALIAVVSFFMELQAEKMLTIVVA